LRDGRGTTKNSSTSFWSCDLRIKRATIALYSGYSVVERGHFAPSQP